MTDVPFEQTIETLAGMRQDGLIRHIGLSNLSAEQLRTALTIADIAVVTVHYNVAVRLGAAVRQVTEEHSIVFRRGIRQPSRAARKVSHCMP